MGVTGVVDKGGKEKLRRRGLRWGKGRVGRKVEIK